jgi:hypothetical protein
MNENRQHGAKSSARAGKTLWLRLPSAGQDCSDVKIKPENQRAITSILIRKKLDMR